jgi:hypothetical protein
MNDYVVTYRMDHPSGCSIAEFFRGPKDECDRIARSFGGGGNDKKRVTGSTVIVGTAKAWEEFLKEWDPE